MRDFTVQGVQARPSIRPAFVQKLTLGEVRDEVKTLATGGTSEKFDALHEKDVAVK